MKMRRTLSAVGAALALALIAGGTIAGCGSSSSSGSGSGVASSRSLTIRVTGDYDTLDPYKTVAAASFSLDAPTYDRFVYTDDKGHILPYLATSWTVTPTSIALHVKQGVKCADGSALTPADMAAALRRFTSPQTKSPTVAEFFGAGPFTVTSTGETVTLRTKTPSATLLPGLSQVAVICPAGLKNPTSLANKPDGSGPYVLTSAQRGNSYTFTRRSGWTWGPAAAVRDLPRTLVYKVIANDSTAANLLGSGGLDIAQVNGPDTKRLSADPSLKLHPHRDFGMTFMQFNEAPGHVTADLAVRRGLAEAVDRNAWNKAAADGAAHPSPSIFPTNLRCYDAGVASVDPPFDAAAAKADLAKAGYTPGPGGTLTKGGKPLTVKVIGWEDDQLGPDYVAAALQKIGVKATLRKTDIATYVESAQKGDFEVGIVPSEAAAPLPTQNVGFLSGAGGKVGLNWGLTKNAVADHWTSVAGKSLGAAQCAAWSKVQRALAQSVDLKPLTSETYSYFARSGIDFQATGPTLLPWSIKAG
jgi:peptide/nickel transport system substrate-binding protein